LVLPLRRSVSKKTVFGKSHPDPQGRRDMSCSHGFTLGTHSKTGAFWSQLDRFKSPAELARRGAAEWR
jgi:hypothetical protein